MNDYTTPSSGAQTATSARMADRYHQLRPSASAIAAEVKDRLKRFRFSLDSVDPRAAASARAISNELAQYTYKPGFEFGLRLDRDWFAIDLHVEVADVRDAGKKIALTMPGHKIEWIVVLRHSPAAIAELVSYNVNRITEAWEHHERIEWLRKNGESVDQRRLDRDHGWPAP